MAAPMVRAMAVNSKLPFSFLVITVHIDGLDALIKKHLAN